MGKKTKVEDELVTVRVAFSTRVRFDEEVCMTRSMFDRLTAQIEDDDDIDLTEWIDWDNPIDVGDSDVDEFELVTEVDA